MTSANDVIKVANAEIGYLEKKTNSQLDDKIANAGSGNFTKYARDLDAIANFYNGKKNGYAWCDVFVDWCFVKAFGVDKAKSLLCQPSGSLGAGCTYSARYYKNNGQFYSSPKIGDQIFFGSGLSDCTHTGLVYKIDGSKVYTIEGNTSGASGVVANGGGVCAKSYSLTYSKIVGYGRPKYDKESPAPASTSNTSSNKQIVKDLQSTLNSSYKCGLVIDGIIGTKTKAALKKYPIRSFEKNDYAKWVQKRLVAKGYSIGSSGIDGAYGLDTAAAVKKFQKANGLSIDGVCGLNTALALCE